MMKWVQHVGDNKLMEKNQMNEVIYTIGHKKLNGIMKLIANL